MKNSLQGWGTHGGVLYRTRCGLFAALLVPGIAAPPALAVTGKQAGWHPCAMAYVLQADGLSGNRIMAVDALAGTGRDVVVIDRAFRQRDDGWTLAELASLRHRQPARRVLSYLSIGEAEDYRPYWQPGWTPAAAATPDFIVAPNPDWPGNFKVRYWDPRWQELVLADLEALVARQFDGVYLDIVDAFQYFEHDAAAGTWDDHALNPATGRSYRADMVAWVGRIANRARSLRGDFLVVAQNGSALLHEPGYVDSIDAIAVEDLFTLGDAAQDEAHTRSVLADLEIMRSAGKPVLVVEYARDADLRERAARAAHARGFTLVFAPRALDALGEARPPPRCAAGGQGTAARAALRPAPGTVRATGR